MIKVEFNSEIEGVTEVNCHHITVSAKKIMLHFTRLIKWDIEFCDIKQITESQVSCFAAE